MTTHPTGARNERLAARPGLLEARQKPTRPRDELAALGVADYLSLAAAPTFALMAVLTSAFGGGPADVLCSAHASPLGGMVPMYVLMSAFHLAPWLKLIAKAANSSTNS